MNIITYIKTAISNLSLDADVFLFTKARAENEELEHTKDTIIVYPDWRTTNVVTPAMSINKQRVYNIDFKTLDEWDNSDNNILTSYSETTLDKIERMEILADKIFLYITAHKELFINVNDKLAWRMVEPIVRQNNGTMSGVSIELTIKFNNIVNCN